MKTSPLSEYDFFNFHGMPELAVRAKALEAQSAVIADLLSQPDQAGQTSPPSEPGGPGGSSGEGSTSMRKALFARRDKSSSDRGPGSSSGRSRTPIRPLTINTSESDFDDNKTRPSIISELLQADKNKAVPKCRNKTHGDGCTVCNYTCNLQFIGDLEAWRACVQRRLAAAAAAADASAVMRSLPRPKSDETKLDETKSDEKLCDETESDETEPDETELDEAKLRHRSDQLMQVWECLGGVHGPYEYIVSNFGRIWSYRTEVDFHVLWK